MYGNEWHFPDRPVYNIARMLSEVAMDTLAIIFIVIAVVFLLYILIKIFKKPMKLIFKFLLNTLLGFVSLILLNFVGAFIGISIGINWLNAAVVGILGLPGVALLLILQWLMVI